MEQAIPRVLSSYKPDMHENPIAYNVVSTYTLKNFKFTLNRLLGENRKKISGRVLDLGCGNGLVTQYMKEYELDPDAKLSGCDLSESLIDFCRREYSKFGIDFFQLDLETPILDHKRSSFDWILSNYVLHWVVDQRTALSNCYNLLDDNGVFIMLTVPKCFIWEWPKYVAQHPEWKKYYTKKIITYSYNELTEEEAKTKLANDLQEAGFGEVYIEYHNIWNTFSSEQQFKEFLKSICQFYPSIEPEKQELYLDDYVVKMKENECLVPVSKHMGESQHGFLKQKVSILIAKAVKPKK